MHAALPYFMSMIRKRAFGLLATLASCSLLWNGASYAQWYNPFGDKDGDGCGSWDITCNPHVKPLTKPLVEDLWGEAGQTAYKAASEIMYRSNGSSQALDSEQKRWLRPLHGSLVDRVSVIYNSRMMERWGIPGTGKDVVLNAPESEGQTYCNRIYIRASYQPGNIDQIYLLAHELEHSAQCERLGGMGKFGWHYFREYKRAGMSYENNKLEREARSKANMLQNPGSASYSSGYYKRADRPEVYFLNSGSRTLCHVQNPSQMEVYGGFGQVRVTQTSDFNSNASFTGPCLWPDGMYRSKERPEVYYLYDNWKAACWVRTPARVEQLGGWGRVRIIEGTPREALIVGRRYSDSC